MEDHLDPLRQLLGHHRLRHPVSDGGYAQHPGSAAMRLGYLHRAHRRRKVTSRGHPIPDLVQVVVQVGLEPLDRHPVHARRTLVRLDLLPGLLDRPLRNLERLVRRLQLIHATPSEPQRVSVDRTNTATDDPAPSLHPHYRSFPTTTSRSASRTRNGTHTHAAHGLLPLARSQTRTGSVASGLLPFHAEAADRARVASMPDTTWPVSGHPPGSSRDP